MNIAFAGFRHAHINSLYKKCAERGDVNIVAAWEGDAEARAEAVEDLGVNFTHGSYDEMLALPGLDAVAIGDYFSARGGLAVRAMRAGKHVIADKPLCTSLEELDEIERLSAGGGLKVGLMLDLRYLGSTAAARRAVRGGALGRVHNITFGGQHCLGYGERAAWYFEPGKQGGTINDIAIHGVDLVRHITGLELRRVLCARCWNAYATEEPHFLDAAQLMAELDGGAGLLADVSYSKPRVGFDMPQIWRMELWGERGMLELNCSRDEVTIARAGAGAPEIITAPPPETDWLNDFITETDGGTPLLSTADAIASTRTALTLQAASERGGSER